MPQSITASSPGSLMLFGEHNVLRKGKAIVAAVEPRIRVSLTPMQEKIFTVHSSLGTAVTSISEISLGKTFRFVEKSLSLFQGAFPSGANIVIESDINPTVGLGSSAAVTVATLACISSWLAFSLDPLHLLERAREVITTVQGCGSGADAAASVFGGVIEYTRDKLSVKPLCETLPLTLVYSGKKTPTQEVISYVNELEIEFPQIFLSNFETIERTTKEAAKVTLKGNLKKLGKLMNIHNGLQEALLVGTPELSFLCWELRRSSQIFGAKISGSGLGDSVVGLGSLLQGEPLFEKQIPIQVSSRGVILS